jgi:hypothetical protein
LAYGGGFYGGYYNNYNNYVGSVIGAETPAKYRSRPAYAASAYNSDFNNNRGAAYNRGSRTNADYSNTNSDYYSRPRRDGSGVTTIQVLPPTHQEVLTVTILTDATTLGIGLLITTIVEQTIRRQIQLGTILQVEVRQVAALVAVAAEVVHVVKIILTND